MSDEMRRRVQKPSAPLYPTAIISGRAREKVYDFVRLPELYYAGSHGLDIVAPPPRVRRARRTSPAVGAGGDGRGVQGGAAAVANIPGASVDHKFASVHYRNCEAKED